MLATENPQLKEVYTAPKGSQFKISVDGALFYIEMVNGGIRPDITNRKFTTFKLAKNELDKYFRNNPKPVPRTKTKEE